MKVQYWPTKAPDPSKPYCLVMPDGSIKDWFKTPDDAENAMDALKGGSQYNEVSYLIPVRNFAEGWDGNNRWIQMYPYDSWDHPLYGKTTIDKSVATKLKESFDKRVKDPKVFTDYEHGLDAAKGNKASGEIQQVEVRDTGLWGLISFTEQAKQEIDAGEWNYFSTSHYDTWTHPQTGETFNYVLNGGGLTNQPWVKGMVPVNFSEIMIENPRNFADWSTAYKNNLPDSAFMWVEPGGKKDSEGKTVPRSLRHFPYKDSNGNVDLAHVRNAIARAPQSNVPDNIKTMVQNKGRRLLGAKNNSELLVVDEMAPEEFQEHDVGPDPFINPDDAADSGSRIDTPPGGEDGTVPSRSDTVTKAEGGNVMPDVDEAAIRTELGLEADVDLLEHIKSINAELEPLRALKAQHEKDKTFSEQYPDEAAELESLKKSNRGQIALNFSEKLASKRASKITGKNDEGENVYEPTTLGLSGLALESVTEIVRKFNERTVTLEDFSGVMDAILNGGIVDYGNKGSELAPTVDDVIPQNYTEARKQFSEKVHEIMENDKLDYEAALAQAIQKHPELFEEYRKPPVIATA